MFQTIVQVSVQHQITNLQRATTHHHQPRDSLARGLSSTQHHYSFKYTEKELPTKITAKEHRPSIPKNMRKAPTNSYISYNPVQPSTTTRYTSQPPSQAVLRRRTTRARPIEEPCMHHCKQAQPSHKERPSKEERPLRPMTEKANTTIVQKSNLCVQ